ncbi:MAG: N-acetylneuraminate synthase family protein [Nitrosopumilaceae archaeon]
MNDHMIFVVAEIGVNWDGDFELAKEMMTVAKKVGCNAVKFQAYDEKLMSTHPERSSLMKSTISKTNIETINSLSKSIGIEWFCTPMYLESVDLLDPYVQRFKIRELDSRSLLENKTTPLFERILKTNKEIIISSQKSPYRTKYFNHPKVRWLYCVPKYPCDLNDIDFTNFKYFHGFSNHSPMLIAPLTAAILGGKIIEVHITKSKSKNFIDNNVSLDYSELEELVNLIRLSEKMKK